MSKAGLSANTNAGLLKASSASNGSLAKGQAVRPSSLLSAATSATSVTATTININPTITTSTTSTYPVSTKVGSGGATLETAPFTVTSSSWLPKLQQSGGATVNLGKGTMQASHDHNDDHEELVGAAGLPTITAESVSKEVAPFLTKHIPERYASVPPQAGTQPGGTKYCYRHRPDIKCRRQADEITMDSLQKVLIFHCNYCYLFPFLPPAKKFLLTKVLITVVTHSDFNLNHHISPFSHFFFLFSFFTRCLLFLLLFHFLIMHANYDTDIRDATKGRPTSHHAHVEPFFCGPSDPSDHHVTRYTGTVLLPPAQFYFCCTPRPYPH